MAESDERERRLADLRARVQAELAAEAAGDAAEEVDVDVVTDGTAAEVDAASAAAASPKPRSGRRADRADRPRRSRAERRAEAAERRADAADRAAETLRQTSESVKRTATAVRRGADTSLLAAAEAAQRDDRAAGDLVYDHLPEALREAAETSLPRIAAAWLILAGALLGLLSGALLWAGNPDIVNEILSEAEPTSLGGQVLNNTTGEPIAGVLIQVLDDGGAELRRTDTGASGRFLIDEVAAEEVTVVASKDGHGITSVRLIPRPGNNLLLSLPWEGDTTTDDRRSTSLLPAAVTTSTVVALLTIGFAFVGLQAAVMTWQGKRYRRTLWFAGLGMLSRGMVVLGPLLIIIGMGLIVLTKHQFDDQVA